MARRDSTASRIGRGLSTFADMWQRSQELKARREELAKDRELQAGKLQQDAYQAAQDRYYDRVGDVSGRVSDAESTAELQAATPGMSQLAIPGDRILGALGVLQDPIRREMAAAQAPIETEAMRKREEFKESEEDARNAAIVDRVQEIAELYANDPAGLRQQLIDEGLLETDVSASSQVSAPGSVEPGPPQKAESDTDRLIGRATQPEPEKPSEFQRRAALVSAGGIDANSTAMQIEKNILENMGEDGNFLGFGIAGALSDLPGLGITASEAKRSYAQAQDAYFDLLRTVSGAAISEAESDRLARRFFAQIGDSPAVMAQRQKDRVQYLINNIKSGGPASEELGATADQVIQAVGDSGAFDALTDEQIRRYIEMAEGG